MSDPADAIELGKHGINTRGLGECRGHARPWEGQGAQRWEGNKDWASSTWGARAAALVISATRVQQLEARLCSRAFGVGQGAGEGELDWAQREGEWRGLGAGDDVTKEQERIRHGGAGSRDSRLWEVRKEMASSCRKGRAV